MKKILLCTLFSMFVVMIVSAQLVIGEESLTLEGPANEELFGETSLSNSADSVLDLRWVRTFVSIPEEWDNFFCALPGNCGLPGTDSLNFELPAGSTEGLLQCHCIPHDLAGMAEVNVKIIDNSTNEVLGTVNWICNASVVSTNELEKANIKLFPNPASDYFKLVNGSKVDQIVMYNILGKQVKIFGKEDENFHISDLVKGIYLVQLIDIDTNVTKTMKLNKN